MTATAAPVFIALLEAELSTVEPTKLYPGKRAPEGAGNKFGTYDYIQNCDYQQPYINLDNLTLRLINTNYSVLQTMVNKLLRLNVENPLNGVGATLRAQNIYLQDLVVRTAAGANNEFVESTDYFQQTFDILFQYTELVPVLAQDAQLTFIEGV